MSRFRCFDQETLYVRVEGKGSKPRRAYKVQNILMWPTLEENKTKPGDVPLKTHKGDPRTQQLLMRFSEPKLTQSRAHKQQPAVNRETNRV